MRMPFLSNLGVLAQDQARNPCASSFPHAFNPACQHVWDAVVTGMLQGKDVAANWGHAITLFIEVCIAKDMYPFSNLKQSANDSILTDLQDARLAVVKFMNLSKMLSFVNIKATSREVELTNTGFVLRVYGKAILKQPNDPTFEKWLLQMPYPRFDLKDHGRYVKHLSHTVAMVVFNEGASMSQRWHVGYEIICNQFPDIPGKHTPTKEQIETFILDILWMPVLKSRRPIGWHHRLI
jgi:hypothetical protein